MALSSHFLDEDKALACVHCGLCLGSCPTYLETGNENDSPRGRVYLMRSIENGRLSLNGSHSPVSHMDRCLGCRACETACPSGVAYGQLLEATRDHIERHARRPWYQRLLRRWLIEKIFPFPTRFRWAVLPAMAVKRMDIASLLPRFLSEAMELLPDKLSRVRLPALAPSHTQPARGRVGLLTGCVMPVLFGKTHQSTIQLIQALGFDVVIPSQQRCCGALHAHSGKLAEARELAQHNLQVFEQADCDVVLANAAGCGSTLKEYDHLLSQDPVVWERASQFVAKVRDFSEWMEQQGASLRERFASAHAQGWSLPEPLNGLTTFHDACHLAHAQGITMPPRQWVQAVAGPHYVELNEADICCGSAGSYNLTEPEMAARLQLRKTSHIRQSKASLVITTNPGCILQIQSGLRKEGLGSVRVMHLADYLEMALRHLPSEIARR